MKDLTKKEKRCIAGIVVLYGMYDFSVLLVDLFGIMVQVMMGFICFVLLCFITTKCMNMKVQNIFIFLLIASINSSYYSMIGVPYNRLPLTWFLLASVMIIFLCHLKIQRNLALLAAVLLLVFFAFSIVYLRNQNLAGAVNQGINLFVFLLMLSCAKQLRRVCDVRTGSCAQIIYLGSVFMFSLMVVLQKYLCENRGLDIGHIGKYAMRTSYAATFYDFSFATLYVASGFCMLFAGICYKIRLLSWNNSLILMGVYIYAVLIINARTGLVALVLAVFLMFVYLIIKRKRAQILVVGICTVPVVLLLLLFMSSRREGMFSSSGRIDGYIAGLKCFMEHFWIGNGFGIQNYGLTIPHNLIVQYLAQFGIIGFSIILIGMYPVLKKILLDKESIIRWTVMTVVIGSMFIPDIVSSHYLTVVIVLAFCETHKKLQQPVQTIEEKAKR
ncbi:MAG: O-antigen ligase family protein [Lachnospiraceae bacterium]|nr:O-antigen ligase family protein [Lachnospiraceae bacterium]